MTSRRKRLGQLQFFWRPRTILLLSLIFIAICYLALDNREDFLEKVGEFWRNGIPRMERGQQDATELIEEKDIPSEEQRRQGYSTPDGVKSADDVNALVHSTGAGVVVVRSFEGTGTVDHGIRTTHFRNSVGFVVQATQFTVIIATAAHSLLSDEVEICFDGRCSIADTLLTDRSHDLALIRLSTRAFQPAYVLQLANQHKTPQDCWIVRPGEQGQADIVHGKVLGRPDSFIQYLSRSSTYDSLGESWFLISQISRKGDSGSPIVNSNGEVIGMLVAGVDAIQSSGKSLAIDSVVVRNLLAKV